MASAGAGAGALVLEHSRLTNNDQAFTNAVYVNPSDFARVVEAAGADAEKVKEIGVLCAVGEAVFFVRQAPTFKQGTIGVGMLQCVAGAIAQGKPTPVTPFYPPRGNFPLANIVFEIDLLSATATAPGQVRSSAAPRVLHCANKTAALPTRHTIGLPRLP